LKVEIENKKENPIQQRVEVQFTVDHAGEPTPTRDAVRTKIAEAMGEQKDKIIVDSMETEYGKGRSRGYAKVYENQDAAKKHENYHLLVRNKMADKKVKEKAAPKARAAPKAK
jgi:small subunit ribosomal protein S24e